MHLEHTVASSSLLKFMDMEQHSWFALQISFGLSEIISIYHQIPLKQTLLAQVMNL